VPGAGIWNRCSIDLALRDRTRRTGFSASRQSTASGVMPRAGHQRLPAHRNALPGIGHPPTSLLLLRTDCLRKHFCGVPLLPPPAPRPLHPPKFLPCLNLLPAGAEIAASHSFSHHSSPLHPRRQSLSGSSRTRKVPELNLDPLIPCFFIDSAVTSDCRQFQKLDWR